MQVAESRLFFLRAAGLGLAALLALTAVVYFPGLRGAFLLDDHASLSSLQDIRADGSPDELWGFATSGLFGAYGRTLSLLSFAFQFSDWPADPWPFKFVNLVLHLLNGCLLFWLFLRLAALVKLPARQGLLAGLFASAVWLLHPLNVSTTLYVIQRMTQLSALFTVAGLLIYIQGRQSLRQGNLQGYAWLTAGFGLCAILAFLCKENGILLLLYAWVIDATLFKGSEPPPYWRAWKGAVLHLPLLAVAGYVLLRWNTSILPTFQFREFGPGQRLLTEARVLVDYLGLIVFPRPGALGLFHDDFVTSRGLLDPPQTLAAALFLLVLLGAALGWVRRAPVFSFAVLWFFAGHVLESTIIPLEIYFEHRNYLPMAGVIWGATFYAARGLERLPHQATRRFLLGAGLAWLALLSAVTWNEARLWGNPALQAVSWSREKPRSVRAQELLGNALAARGRYREAADLFARLARGELRHAAAYLSLLRLGCYDGRIKLPDPDEVAAGLRTTRYSNAPVTGLIELVALKEQGRCPRTAYAQILPLFEALMDNPAFGGVQAHLHGLLGRLQAAEMLIDPAIQSLDRADALAPSVQTPLLQARVLVYAGRYDEALVYVDKARRANRAHRPGKALRDKEIGEMEAVASKLNSWQK